MLSGSRCPPWAFSLDSTLSSWQGFFMGKTIKLSLEEKAYLVALYGDIPMRRREAMFRFGTFPAQAGPLVMQGGYDFRGELNDGRLLYRKRGPHPLLCETPAVKQSAA